MLSLRSFHIREGEDMVHALRLMQGTYCTFSRKYTRNFSFDMRASRLQGAFLDVSEYSDDRTEDSIVDTFLSNISGDSPLASACTLILKDVHLSAGFKGAIQYLSNEAVARSCHTANKNTRTISFSSSQSPRKDENSQNKFGRNECDS